jgi:hypothetical protein
MGRREWWGYAVWLFVGLVIVVPELWAALGSPRWLTISATVGHLEQLWSPVKIIVIGLIVAAAVQILTYPPSGAGAARLARNRRGRTANGRLTRAPERKAQEFTRGALYFPASVGVVAAVGAATAVLGANKYVTGYVIYGLIAVTVMIIPSVLAFWFATEVPYPTLYRTLADLERRVHAAVTLILVGLAILAVHLVAFPWP